VTFVCARPAQNVPESRAELDAAPILTAAAEAIELWPEGEPEPGGETITHEIIGFAKPEPK
jgi:hypothetical protein